MKRGIWIAAGLGVAVLALVLLIPPFLASQRTSSAGSAWLSTLRTIHGAQEDFKGKDRDGNGKADFWRRDIAGLYTTKGKDGKEIGLIEVSTSRAETTPKAGYLYRAIRFADETSGALDPQRYAVCAFPSTPDAGKNMAVLAQDGVIWLKAAAPGGVAVYPAEPAKEGWRKID